MKDSKLYTAYVLVASVVLTMWQWQYDNRYLLQITFAWGGCLLVLLTNRIVEAIEGSGQSNPHGRINQ